MKRLAAIVVCGLGASVAAGSPPTIADLRAEVERALAPSGVDAVADVRVPRPDWVGYPAFDRVPFVLPHLHEALVDPWYLVRLGDDLIEVARETKEASGLDVLPFLTAAVLQPRLASFRGYSPPVPELPDRPGVLTAILRAMRRPGDRRAEPSTDWLGGGPLPAPGAEELGLPKPLRQLVAELLAVLENACRWVDFSWERLPKEEVARAVAVRDLASLLPGGGTFWPEVERCAVQGDDAARAQALVLTIAGVQRAVAALTRLGAIGWSARWEVKTRRGRVIMGGEGRDRHVCNNDCLLIVDLGGDDEYVGSAAGAVYPAQPVSVVIDMGGNDLYDQAGALAAQGAGLGGIGVLVDVAGNDRYQARSAAQGCGLLGYGLLLDLGGSDTYAAESWAQAAAVFGGGMLLDAGGNDSYRILGEGQGFGGPAGCGVLADLAGDDSYYAEPDARVAGRADYHSHGRVAANNAQGAGVGRRGDLTDGRAWAGGVGILLDLEGNDRYRAGNFSQGMGYWFGTGMLLDGGGDDEYSSVYFSQGAGCHFGAGLLLDRGGNDIHWLAGESGASLGYAWDRALGVLVDLDGDDLYRLAGTGLGCAERDSRALFVDARGHDTYLTSPTASSLGAVDDRGQPPRLPFRGAAAESGQVAAFVDLEGEDCFLDLEGRLRPELAYPWIRIWPDAGGSWRGRNVGIGVAGP